jgi:hypothetical protein
MQRMIAVNREITDYVPFYYYFFFISHKLLLQYAQILVGIYIRGSSDCLPKIELKRTPFDYSIIHPPK